MRRAQSAGNREVRTAPEKQQADVVGDQVQLPVLVAGAPSDPGVARAALERRRREGGQRRPRAAVVVGHVPDGLADLPRRAEMVLLVHECAGARLVFRRRRRNGQAREAKCRPGFASGQEASWTA